MKKYIAVFLMSIALWAWCQVPGEAIFGIEGMLKGLIQNEFSLFKASIGGDFVKVNGNIDSLAKVVADINVKMDTVAQGVAGINTTVQNMKAGRDIINNDTGLMWKIIYGLLGVIGSLIGLISLGMRLYFREQSNARYYQMRLAVKSEPEEFEAEMKTKKAMDADKAIVNRVRGAVEGVIGMVKSKGGSDEK